MERPESRGLRDRVAVPAAPVAQAAPAATAAPVDRADVADRSRSSRRLKSRFLQGWWTRRCPAAKAATVATAARAVPVERAAHRAPRTIRVVWPVRPVPRDLRVQKALTAGTVSRATGRRS